MAIYESIDIKAKEIKNLFGSSADEVIMKVVYDHQMFSVQKYGGVTRYFYELNKELNKIGIDSSIRPFVYLNNYLHDFEYEYGYYFKHLPNKIRIKVNNKLTDMWLKSNHPDILHYTNYTDHRYVNSNAIKVVTVYDMIHEKFWNKFSETKRQSIMSADHVICISESTRNDLLEILPVKRENTSVVYLGASIPDVGLNIRIVKDKYILYVGHRDAYKNFSILLDAFEELGSIKNDLKIVAFGKALKTREIRELERRNLRDNVIQLSGSDELLANLYSFAELLAYPSEYEGFGLPPLEAMQIGCPVICSNTSSIPEVVGNAAFMVKPRDSSEIARGIQLIMSDKDYRKELVDKGKKQAKLFSWEKCARDTLSVYKKLLEDK